MEFLIAFAAISLISIFKSVIIVRQEQRAGVFCLGKFTKVLQPGVHIVIPAINRVDFLDINKSLPGWRGYSAKELQSKLKDLFVIGGSVAFQPLSPPSTSANTDGQIPAEVDSLSAWLVEAASRQTGANLASDKLAITRIHEQAAKALKEIELNGKYEINLPYLTADASGPKHFQIILDKSNLHSN